jgi:hypothetical protein
MRSPTGSHGDGGQKDEKVDLGEAHGETKLGDKIKDEVVVDARQVEIL